MRLESKKLLEDVAKALDLLDQFAAGRTFEDYQRDPMLRAAVEREFEIVGEALKQLSNRDPESAERIPELRRIVSFRNILIHGYAESGQRHRLGSAEHASRAAPSGRSLVVASLMGFRATAPDLSGRLENGEGATASISATRSAPDACVPSSSPLVRRNPDQPGTHIMDVSAPRRAALERQLETDLKPVLRPED